MFLLLRRRGRTDSHPIPSPHYETVADTDQSVELNQQYPYGSYSQPYRSEMMGNPPARHELQGEDPSAEMGGGGLKVAAEVD